MNDELQTLHLKVNTIIYNPFINLKEQATEIKKTIQKQGAAAELAAKVDETISALDQLESLNHGSVERIKGFNKAKSVLLKIIKELEETKGN